MWGRSAGEPGVICERSQGTQQLERAGPVALADQPGHHEQWGVLGHVDPVCGRVEYPVQLGSAAAPSGSESTYTTVASTSPALLALRLSLRPDSPAFLSDSRLPRGLIGGHPPVACEDTSARIWSTAG